MSQHSFDERVYEIVREIPTGRVATYGQIARALGNKGLARAVGNALHRNPDGNKTPCYKVLNAKGELAEGFVFGGSDEQAKRLKNDGIEVVGNKVDLSRYGWDRELTSYDIEKRVK